MFPTFEYEVTSRFFGVQQRAEYIQSATGVVMWVGPWRFRRKRVLDDIMGHTFEEFMELFVDRVQSDTI